MSDLSINVNIGGRNYPLTISRNEEEQIRKAVSEINNNIKNLKENYAVKDMQDLLAMTVLQYASETVKVNNSVEFDKLQDAVLALNSELKNS
ncbi:MAG: cell division protein ZapA [Flavobacteriales bacterium]|nr:cell division protein ZapA [Flavobacteriales bacterium]